MYPWLREFKSLSMAVNPIWRRWVNFCVTIEIFRCKADFLQKKNMMIWILISNSDSKCLIMIVIKCLIKLDFQNRLFDLTYFVIKWKFLGKKIVDQGRDKRPVYRDFVRYNNVKYKSSKSYNYLFLLKVCMVKFFQLFTGGPCRVRKQ